MKIRVSKMSGFGRLPAVEFRESPVIIGSSVRAAVRFTEASAQVAGEHAALEWNGQHWVVRDLGSAAGVLVKGRRILAPEILEPGLELELGSGGPRVRIEALEGASTATPPTAAAAAPAFAPASTPASLRPTYRRAQRPLWPIAAGALFLLACVGAGWWLLREPQLAPVPELPPRVAQSPKSEPAAEAAPAPVPAPAPAEAPSSQPIPAAIAGSDEPPPLPAIAQNFPEQLQQALNSFRQDKTTRGMARYLLSTKTRSPYTRALLQHKAQWYEQMTPWLAKRLAQEGFELPGIFIGELFGAPYALPGTPASPDPLVAQLSPALFPPGTTAPGGQIASALSARRSTPLPPKNALSARYRSFARSDAPATSAAPGKTWGVFVGISDFEAINDLFGCRNDVAAISKILLTQGLLEPETMRLLTDARKGTPDYPTKANVVAALQETFQAAGPNDTIYLWFSTHGDFSKEKNDSLLVMADSTAENPDSMLYGQELQALLAQVKARSLVVVMDACHTGGMGSLGGNQYSATRPKRALSGEYIPEEFYQKLATARGHVVIRACRADQTTPDLAFLGHGLLTAVTIAGLTGDADANHDGIVTLSELRIYVTTAIPKICLIAGELGDNLEENGGPLEPTFTSSSFGEAGDLPITVVSLPTE